MDQASDSGTIVAIAVGLYMLAMLVIGIIAARKAGSFDDFAVAGRKLPLSITSMTLLATWLGAGTIMGAAGSAYEGGLLSVIIDPFGAGLSLLIAGFLVVRVMRRLELVSVIDLIQRQYGNLAATLGSAGLIIAYGGWSAAQFVAFGLILNSLIGIDITTGIIVGSAIVLLYTATGGMWAVAMTDFMQMAMIMIGIVTLSIFVVDANGGLFDSINNAPENGFRLYPLEHTGEAWVAYLRDWAAIGIGSIVAQDLLQRSFAAKTEGVAVDASYLAGIGYLTIGVLPAILGVIAVAIVPEIDDPERVIIVLAESYLTPLLLAIFLGALLAAIMSSADSALLATATIFTSNFLPLFKSELSDKSKLSAARYAIIVTGLVALAVGLWFKTVYDLMVNAFAVIAIALPAPALATLYWKRVNAYGVQAGMIMGYATWLGLPYIMDIGSSDFLGMIVNAVVLILVSLATQKACPPKPLIGPDGKEFPLTDRLGLPGLSFREKQ